MQNDECKMQNDRRLIDANALLELVQYRLPIDNQNAEVIAGCVNITRRLIGNAPTVDAVEVVRCKDCKHRGSNLCPMETIELYPWFGTKNDAFCSYGERREGE